MSCSSTATACRARAGFPRRGSISPRTCCAGATTATAIVFWGEDRVKSRVTLRRALCRSLALRAGAARGRASGPATASPATCPTCRAPSSRCWRRPASARSGRRARRISARRACSTASARSSRKCCLPPTAISTTARRSTCCRDRCARSRDSCRRSRASIVVPYTRERARDLADDPQRRRCARFHGAVQGARDRLSSACRSIIRSTSCIRRAPPACPNASCTARAARCCSI